MIILFPAPKKNMLSSSYFSYHAREYFKATYAINGTANTFKKTKTDPAHA